MLRGAYAYEQKVVILVGLYLPLSLRLALVPFMLLFLMLKHFKRMLSTSHLHLWNLLLDFLKIAVVYSLTV